jgi:hypothetical protein
MSARARTEEVDLRRGDRQDAVLLVVQEWHAVGKRSIVVVIQSEEQQRVGRFVLRIGLKGLL